MNAKTVTGAAGEPSGDRDALFEECLAGLRAGEVPVTPHFVDGEELLAGKEMSREDPCHPDRIAARFHAAPDALVGQAVAAARRALPAWDALGPAGRAARLRPAIELLDQRRLTEIAALVSLETGKSRAESFKEADELLVLMERYCEIAGDPAVFSEALGPEAKPLASRSVLRPYGVFGVISPFNYPTALGAGPAVAALVAGNTVVMKPPHQGPRSAYVFIELLRRCDLPAGVVNMVHGEDDPGKALVAADIDGVAFTGSYAAGMSIFRAFQSGPFPRPVIAEMGGNSPVVVTDTADLERAAEGIAVAAFGLTGQRCNACRRAVVTAGVHDELVARIARRAAELTVGDPIERDAFAGPLIGAYVVDDYERVVARAARDGRIEVGGRRAAGEGYFVEPTVVSGLSRGHALTREENFMPILTVTKVADFEEAVSEANETDLGLAAGIYTGDPEEARAYLRRAEAGCVNVNVPGGATTNWWPGTQTFGGWKGSGSTGKQAFGRWYVQQFGRERCQSVATDFDLAAG